MCLAVPAKIVALDGTDATVEMDGVRRPANVAFIDRPAIGDFVLLHAGFAIRKWDAENVREYEAMVNETRRPDPAAGEAP